VQLRRRFARGVQYQISYSHSKALDESSGINNISGFNGGGFIQNPYDVRADYGLASFDQPNRLTANGTWELPVGKAKRWSLGAADWILGGWKASGIYTVTSGRTFTVYPFGEFGGFDEMGTFLVGRYRANQTGDANRGFSRSNTEWFNTSVFSAPAPGTYGDERKGSLRGPHFMDLDLSFGKEFTLTERQHLQYRLEIFNVGSNWHSVARVPDGEMQDGANFGGLYNTTNGAGEVNLWTPRQLQMSLIYSF
jgi:hypothetical protein